MFYTLYMVAPNVMRIIYWVRRDVEIGMIYWFFVKKDGLIKMLWVFYLWYYSHHFLSFQVIKDYLIFKFLWVYFYLTVYSAHLFLFFHTTLDSHLVIICNTLECFSTLYYFSLNFIISTGLSFLLFGHICFSFFSTETEPEDPISLSKKRKL